MPQTIHPTWTLACQGNSLVLSYGRSQERWDVDHPWTARDMREVLHTATGSDLADGATARAKPRGPIAFVRESRFNPDGTHETRERHGYATVGAGNQQVGDCECHSGADCETPEICAHERNEAALRQAPASAALHHATQISRAIGNRPRRFVVTVNANEVSIDDLHTPPTPDLAARLDGLSAKLDALAERLGGKRGWGEPYAPSPFAVDMATDTFLQRFRDPLGNLSKTLAGRYGEIREAMSGALLVGRAAESL